MRIDTETGRLKAEMERRGRDSADEDGCGELGTEGRNSGARTTRWEAEGCGSVIGSVQKGEASAPRKRGGRWTDECKGIRVASWVGNEVENSAQGQEGEKRKTWIFTDLLEVESGWKKLEMETDQRDKGLQGSVQTVQEIVKRRDGAGEVLTNSTYS
ncbi:uncharacterized protein LAJ45_10288 [Morchella importuna]|uniref:uncharacterized protein n=1 Tax=Morchella importuna TaxID=1174673 RepID=UPI001E8CBD78|nr:uncharacterized protein LAJ45_10288 [Morchella importuna]KAH8145648.1 hypothetical protein LAJ45_10288 [Morchella importuna]